MMEGGKKDVNLEHCRSPMHVALFYQKGARDRTKIHANLNRRMRRPADKVLWSAQRCEASLCSKNVKKKTSNGGKRKVTKERSLENRGKKERMNVLLQERKGLKRLINKVRGISFVG